MRDAFRESWQRVRAFFRRGEMDQDLNAEMASHLEMAVEENLQKGMTEQEARREAAIRFGGTQQAREGHREARGLPWLEVLLQDLRYTLRGLRRDRAFALIAILILALGIGANIAVFSLVNTLLLRPLPFREPSRIAWLAGNSGAGGLSMITYRVDAFEEFRRHNHSFEDVTAYIPFLAYSDFVLSGGDQPMPVSGMHVAGNFFQTLGVQPMLGRAFSSADCTEAGSFAVILSFPFWQQHFAGDRSIVGRSITLNNRSFTVVGVLPPTFDFSTVFAPGTKQDLFLPTKMDGIRNYGHMLSLIGRLKDGVTLAQAQAESDVLFPQLRGSGNESWASDIHTSITPLQDHVSGKLRRPLLVLWAAVALILLIVCSNLANLLLARMASRSKEFAMRIALGAGRSRLIRQLLTESLALSAIGGAIGVLLAFGATWYLAHQGSLVLPLLSFIRVDAAALAWTLLLTFAVGTLFGLAPGLAASRGNPQECLQDADRGSSEGRGAGRMRSTLVVCELALVCVLLVGAGLLLRSFLSVLDVDLGFQPAQTAAIKVDYDDAGSAAKRSAIFQEVLQRVGVLPGIEATGMSDMLPLDRNRSWGLIAKGSVHAKDEDVDAIVRVVTPGYIRAMGMHLVEGRDFSWHDSPDSAPVIIINETAARRHWPGESPIGRLAEYVGDKDSTVIGVIADVRQSGLEESVSPEVFVSGSQFTPDGAELVVRSALPRNVLAPTLIRTLRELNPAQSLEEFRPIQQLVDHSVSPRRFLVYLVAIFAALGLILAALGIYGVVSYSVTRQTHEIGIRMALGASSGQVQWGVIVRTMRLALVGIAMGTMASFAISRWIGSLLYKTAPTDPVAFAITVVLLTAIAVFAGYLPSLRASRIDPIVALRHE